MPRTRPNSRVKDLPDIALLATARAIEGARLREAIDRTFAHSATHSPPRTTPFPPPFWEPVYARMAEIDRLPWSTIRELHERVAAFLDPVFGGGVVTNWNPSVWGWSS
jgi:hypothetical protein